MSRIALIGLSELEIRGILGILQECSEKRDQEGEDEAIISRFASLRDLRHEVEKNDSFIVGLEQFLENIDFFIPRRSRTVVLSQGYMRKDTYPEDKNQTGVMRIYRDSPYQDIVKIFGKLSSVSDRNPDVSGDLSSRETDVLKELASGKTNKEIAEKLSISVNTVITHRKNISAKLGIKSISGLSLYALMNGLI